MEPDCEGRGLARACFWQKTCQGIWQATVWVLLLRKSALALAGGRLGGNGVPGEDTASMCRKQSENTEKNK